MIHSSHAFNYHLNQMTVTTALYLTTLSAALFSVADLGKKYLLSTLSPAAVAWIPGALGTLATAALIPIYDTSLNDLALVPIIFGVLAGLIGVFTEINFVRSIKVEDMSLVIPFTAFSPVCAGIGGAIFLQEYPAPIAFLGIAFLVFGSWLMFARVTLGPKEVFRLISSNQGVRLMLLVCVLNTAQILCAKFGMSSGREFQYVTILLLTQSIFLGWATFRCGGASRLVFALSNFRLSLVVIGVSVLWTIAFNCYFLALLGTQAGYVSALHRMHALFTVWLGCQFLKERDFTKRLVASLVMVFGVSMVVLGAKLY